MKMKRLLKRIAVIISAALLCVFSAFESFAAPTAFADETDNLQEEFENINVLDDLEADEKFNIQRYPFFSSPTPQMYLINVVEFCYSYDEARRDNYGLYLYIYNPQGKKINVDSAFNKITMATEYDSMPVTEESKPKDYDTFDLQFCSVSDKPNYERLFYKFKVKGAEKGLTLLNSNSRRYDIARMQFIETGKTLATSYPIVADFSLIEGVEREANKTYGTFYFKGYAKGFGPNEEADSTLEVKYEQSDTIRLDLHHTFWRSTDSALGQGHHNQLDSVYFSVPNLFFEKYGESRRIKAEWYEYKTKPIVVTDSSELEMALQDYIGVNIGEHTDDLKYDLGTNYTAGDSTIRYDWTYNVKLGMLSSSGPLVRSNSVSDTLYWLFGVDHIGSYSSAKDFMEAGGISSEQILDYITHYNKTFKNGKIAGMDNVSADLFEDDIEESRKQLNDPKRGQVQYGYSCYDFDAKEDLFSWKSYKEGDPSFMDRVNKYGFWSTLFKTYPEEESGAQNVSCIRELDWDDISTSKSNDTIANSIYVNPNDVSALQDYYKANAEDNRIVLFRFANTDYYSERLAVEKRDDPSGLYNFGAYMTYETVFLNFNVIQLTFFQDGEYTVIPVVSDPIHAIADLYSPTDYDKYNPHSGCQGGFDWKKILALIAIILLFIVLMPLLPTLVNVVIKILMLPFKLIGAIIKGIEKAFHKRE